MLTQAKIFALKHYLKDKLPPGWKIKDSGMDDGIYLGYAIKWGPDQLTRMVPFSFDGNEAPRIAQEVLHSTWGWEEMGLI